MERIWERTGDDELLRWVFEALGVGRGFSLGYKIEVSHDASFLPLFYIWRSWDGFR